MIHDTLSYLLAHLNLAFKQKRFEIFVPNTKMIGNALLLLFKLGYINSYIFINSKQIKICLKYNEHGQSAIRQISRISRPGARVYISYKELAVNWSRLNNLNNVYQAIILSTSKGILTHHNAIKRKVGGEVLFVIN